MSSKGELDEAIDQYRTAVELDPQDANAHDNLGAVLARKGELDEAIDEHRTAIELDPQLVNAHINLGNALDSKGEHDEAIDQYRTAVELDPNNASHYTNLVWFLATADDPELRNPTEAVTLARKATELQPVEANHWCNLGVAEYRASNWQAAVDAFRQADVLIGGDGDRTHRSFLAMAHWQLGNQAQAQAQAHEAFEQAVNWLNENNINDEQLLRFRDEAERLLKNLPKREKTNQKNESAYREFRKSQTRIITTPRRQKLVQTKWNRKTDPFKEAGRFAPA